MNYVYCIPKGGFNDNLCVINRALEYCKKHNRILLVDTINSTYKVDFGIYFTFKYHNLICDSEKIREILYEKKITIYPSILNDKMNDILNNSIEFTYSKQRFTYKSIITCLPSSDVSENIVVVVACGGGDGYSLFKSIIFKPEIRQIVNERCNLLKKPYTAIQIRNTDSICDYELLYENNKDEINSAIEIYMATDDKNALAFFIDKGLPVKNFTTYPTEDKYRNLHYSNVDPDTKFIDMLSDIYICGMSDKLISSSVGGFIRLIRSCNQNKSDLAKQFEIIDE
jgi:hypothetical protein